MSLKRNLKAIVRGESGISQNEDGNSVDSRKEIQRFRIERKGINPVRRNTCTKHINIGMQFIFI